MFVKLSAYVSLDGVTYGPDAEGGDVVDLDEALAEMLVARGDATAVKAPKAGKGEDKQPAT